MADSILTGKVLLRDWKGRSLSLQASMSAVEGNGKNRHMIIIIIHLSEIFIAHYSSSLSIPRCSCGGKCSNICSSALELVPGILSFSLPCLRSSPSSFSDSSSTLTPPLLRGRWGRWNCNRPEKQTQNHVRDLHSYVLGAKLVSSCVCNTDMTTRGHCNT